MQKSVISALLPSATEAQSRAVLGAMLAVCGDKPTRADRLALESASRFIFDRDGSFDIARLEPVSPATLRAALAGTQIGEDAIKFLTVMALVDGKLDKNRIAAVLAYAQELGIAERYLDEVREAAEGRMQQALADMTRANMESVTGKPWEGDVAGWLLPYDGKGADPELAARFEALGRLDRQSFGHAFWRHFTDNGYAFPGAPKALNAAFSVPHDSVHVLSGFDTTPRGELLASTFTAAMHPKFPMAGHILPVIFSWHLKVQINAVAGDAASALDPVVFWKAWAAGAAAQVDTFAPGWDFWSATGVALTVLRERYGIPAQGVEQA